MKPSSTENRLEDAGGCSVKLLPSAAADVRSSDDAIAF